jgi:hypothetical protein
MSAYVPVGQSLHSDWPASGEYVPYGAVGQGVQSSPMDDPSNGRYVPAPHAEHQGLPICFCFNFNFSCCVPETCHLKLTTRQVL